MQKRLTIDDVKYICKYMMGVSWEPEFVNPVNYGDRDHWKNTLAMQQRILDILSTCQSKLEVMYFLGIAYYLFTNVKTNAEKHHLSINIDYPAFYANCPGSSGDCTVEGQEGIYLSEPWHGWQYWNDCGAGPSSLLIIPQYRSPEKDIHHDFGIFTGASNKGGPWSFYCAIEIEGYSVHKERRDKDTKRYEGLSYEVHSIPEETTEACNWFRIIVDYEEQQRQEEYEASFVQVVQDEEE